MGKFIKLFGIEPKKSKKAVVVNILSIPRNEIESNPASPECLVGAVDIAAEATVKEGKIHLLEITIDGYGTDQRELFEIPEVCDWARRTFQLVPSLYYFLAPDCQWRFIGWLCGPCNSREVVSASFQSSFDKQRTSAIVQSVVIGEEILSTKGADSVLINDIRKWKLDQNKEK